MLHIGDYVPIKRSGKTVAGKIIVYSAEPEQYFAFITFEAAMALEKYIKYREDMARIPLVHRHFSLMHLILRSMDQEKISKQ